MHRLERLLIVASCAALIGVPAQTFAAPQSEYGQFVAPADLGRFTSVTPGGAGLPPGQGDAIQGREVFANQCVACHGEKLEGVKGTGGLALVGGRGTLVSAKPFKTVESYWPYATTVFDYVKRAMPFNAPGSLSDDEVYAVTAYILASGDVIKFSDRLDATTLAKVAMPNRDGFFTDPRPK